MQWKGDAEVQIPHKGIHQFHVNLLKAWNPQRRQHGTGLSQIGSREENRNGRQGSLFPLSKPNKFSRYSINRVKFPDLFSDKPGCVQGFSPSHSHSPRCGSATSALTHPFSNERGTREGGSHYATTGRD